MLTQRLFPFSVQNPAEIPTPSSPRALARPGSGAEFVTQTLRRILGTDRLGASDPAALWRDKPAAASQPALSWEAAAAGVPAIAAQTLRHIDRHFSRKFVTPEGKTILAWGEGLNTSVWDTAMAVIAETEVNRADLPRLEAFARFLTGSQRDDGGWVDSPGDATSGLSASVLGFAALTRLSREGAFFKDTRLVRDVERARQKALGYFAARERNLPRRLLTPAVFAALKLVNRFMHLTQDVYEWWSGKKEIGDVSAVRDGLWEGLRDLYAAGDKAPLDLVTVANPFAQAFYQLVFPREYPKLFVPDPLAVYFPSSQKIMDTVERGGLYGVVSYMALNFAVLMSDERNLKTPAMRDYAARLASMQGAEDGLWSYLLPVTALSVVSLDRAHPDAGAAGAAIARGLAGMRGMTRRGADGAQAYSFDSFTWNNVLYLDNLLRLGLRGPRDVVALFKGVDYLLACQRPDGQFLFSYGSHDAEAENDSTGFIVRLLADLRNWLDLAPEGLLAVEDALALGKRLDAAVARGCEALIRLQNDNGGWAAYVKSDLDKPPGPQPFHPLSRLMGRYVQISPYDASVADITGHALTALAAAGHDVRNSESVRRAVAWLKKDFVPGAGWWGRWGGGYVYGTRAAVEALKRAGVEVATDPQVREAAELLLARQNADGGWGEVGRLVDDASLDPRENAMRGPSNATLTGYAVLTLLDAGLPVDHPAVRKGIGYLIARFKDPSGLEGNLEDLPIAEQDAYLWSDPNAFADFIPTTWYMKENTFGDLVPLLALQTWAEREREASRAA